MSDRQTIGERIAGQARAGKPVAVEIDAAIADAFKAGFEQAVVGGKEYSRRVPQLKDAIPLLLYFDNEKDRQEFADMIHEVKPHMVECKIPEGT